VCTGSGVQLWRQTVRISFAAAPAASSANNRRPCLPTRLMFACSVLGLAAVSLTATLHLPQWSLLHDATAQVRRQLPHTA
jgi:hypothetical protein